MKFIETMLQGAYIIELEPFRDHRGAFARTFCAWEFKEHGLEDVMVQSNLSISDKKNTLRGMHYQVEGAEEAKLVRCSKGSILDCVVDIRRGSETFGRSIMIELSELNNRMVYVPRGCAHGLLTLEDNCHVFYQVSNFYSPGKERGIRWNDPFFKIEWPVTDPIVSEKDAGYADFRV
jgi:dTDP-4-dehydrorhamnose 3,5-epimerase